MRKNASAVAERARSERSRENKVFQALLTPGVTPVWANAKPGEHPHKPAKPPGRKVR